MKLNESRTGRDLPTVVIDARMVKGAPHGFARYISRMAEGLSQIELLPYLPIFLVSPEYRKSDFSGFPVAVARSEFLSPAELLEVPRLLKELGACLYHSPTFSSLFPAQGGLPFALPCPWIQTIHDLNHLHFGGVKERLYYRLLLKPFARRSAAVVTISEFSRAEIAPWLGMDPEAIEMVPNGIATAAEPTRDEIAHALNDFGLTRGLYFLCLSNTKPHKNLPRLVEAYAAYRQKAGSAAWPLLLSVRGLPEVPGLIQSGSIGDHAGQALLAAAGGVVFPSLYEGFGLPPVEAAVQGIPVIVSDIPPHREGLQDLAPEEACWVEPKNTASWADALGCAAKGEVSRPSEISRAKILERYGIPRLGRGMDRLYRRVLGLSP